MGLYSSGLAVGSVAAGFSAWECRSTSGNKPKLLMLGWTSNSTVNATCEFGIGKPTAIGITPTTPSPFVDEDDGNQPSANTTAAIAWGTAPTQPSAFNRRYVVNGAALGNGFIGKFPTGFGLAPLSSIVLWVLSTINAGDVFATVNE